RPFRTPAAAENQKKQRYTPPRLNLRKRAAVGAPAPLKSKRAHTLCPQRIAPDVREDGMNPNLALWLSLGAAVLAVLYGLYSTKWVLGRSAGTPRMQEIAAAIQEGANAYMNRQYLTIAVVGVVLFI